MIWIWWMAQLAWLFLTAMSIHILTVIVLIQVYRNRRLILQWRKTDKY